MNTTILSDELQKQTHDILRACDVALERLSEIEKFMGDRHFTELSFGECFAVRAAVKDVNAVFDDLAQKHKVWLQLAEKAKQQQAE